MSHDYRDATFRIKCAKGSKNRVTCGFDLSNTVIEELFYLALGISSLHVEGREYNYHIIIYNIELDEFYMLE